MINRFEVKLSNVRTVDRSLSHSLYQFVYSCGTPQVHMLCMRQSITMLGKTAFMLRNSIDTYFSFGWAHALWVNFVRRWRESTVVHLGLLPKCVLDKRAWCSEMHVRSSAMHDERILVIVSRSGIGQYALGKE